MEIQYSLDKVENTDGYELYFIRSSDKSTVGSISGINGMYDVVFDTYSSSPPHSSGRILSSLDEAKEYFIKQRTLFQQESNHNLYLLFSSFKHDPNIVISLK